MTKASLEERRRAYRLCFGSVAGQAVLRDLAEFCRVKSSSLSPGPSGSVDPYLTVALEGRREVWLRIEQHSGLALDDLITVLGGRSIPPPEMEPFDELLDTPID
jgi:hypothetical protein